MNANLAVLQQVVNAVPNWYSADYGPNPRQLRVGDEDITVYSHRPHTPDLRRLFGYVQGEVDSWVEQLPPLPTPRSLERIGEDIALRWLEMQLPNIEWPKFLAYLDTLQHRTYENQPISTNLIIDPQDAGGLEVSSSPLQKLLDPLAAGMRTYLRVDGQFRFLNYNEVSWEEIRDPADYKFNPDFLQPFVSVLEPDQGSIHVSRRGDLIVLKKSGLLASRRKGKWHIYDVATFKNSIVDIMGPYRLGCNLFELVFDLSYRRHGALLVYDRDHTVLDKVVNQNSIIDGSGDPDPIRETMIDAIYPIELDAALRSEWKKRVLLEIASLDGAVIFDADHVLAFGAMIQSHEEVGSHLGARTTAAHSAHLWGGKPIKVSSDGEIRVIFKSEDDEGSCTATLDFL